MIDGLCNFVKFLPIDWWKMNFHLLNNHSQNAEIKNNSSSHVLMFVLYCLFNAVYSAEHVVETAKPEICYYNVT